MIHHLTKSIFWHWQNLNEGGSGFWAGRAWLHLNDDGGWMQKKIGVSWYFADQAKHTMFGVRTDFVFEREICFSFGIWFLFNFYLTFAFPFLPNWDYEHGDRVLNIRICDWAIWINLWRNDDGESRNDPWYKKLIVLHIDNFFLGKRKYSERNISEHYAEIPMPEANYPAKITFFESTWKRPRWPYARRMIRANVEMVTPIPFPGKGENSWDCDDDATFSMTGPYDTVDAAVEAVQKSVMRDRERYGGHDWQPSLD